MLREFIVTEITPDDNFQHILCDVVDTKECNKYFQFSAVLMFYRDGIELHKDPIKSATPFVFHLEEGRGGCCLYRDVDVKTGDKVFVYKEHEVYFKEKGTSMNIYSKAKSN